MRTPDPDLEARWRSSGLTAAQFAAQMGFSASALTGWSSKLRKRPAPGASDPAVVAMVSKHAEPERELEVGVARLRVAHGFDTALLAVVRAIGGAS